MNIDDLVEIKGSGYMHKGRQARIVSKSKDGRFCHLLIDGNKWPYEEKDLRLIK